MDAKQPEAVRRAHADLASTFDATLRSPARATPRIRFPVVSITRQALSLLLRNIDEYLRVALPGMLLMLVVWLIYQQTDPSSPPPTTKRLFAWWVATQASLIALMVLAPLAIAVAWHRRLLLGAAAPRPRSTAYARYAARLTLIVFLLSFVSNNVRLGMIANGFDAVTAGFAYAAFLLLGGIAVCRCSLTLPAVACGQAGAGIFASWIMTRGNAFRIFAGCAFLLGCVDVFYRSAGIVLGGLVGSFGIAAASAPAAAVLSALTWTLAIGLLSTYFSLAYRFFAGPQNVDTIRDVFS
jgi:hypothetical protein